jgi:hypothetical protein
MSMTKSVQTCYIVSFPDEIEACPVSIPVTKPPNNKANPKVGVSMAAFSADCKYLYSKNGQFSTRFNLTVLSVAIDKSGDCVSP